ncbi:sigma-70 family RNA polymerase sigma factor [Thauera linaloolentis]|uniref:ECF subfamily RNA polymerase sigma-24 factor n=1 Tax=Thauera linaloolentis (strain DSM 12138 / JCM 21573 / CCUG 41526 / CIP 105981 / IAM 15112 / NBRC 102519 / 47Lol) TaxID=1123367 RepID=N6Z4B5_THAL4|nr:sigma-70 family RNA polymerase sigma factor [Thauera linaloolentis]ENO86969.1 ECF subfamily RNA polymerase sigma-24 factor [Thauera linaloolentis 47Lol = DSM 12138]MCM8564428.1 sigma-70 family RNA polymerase sigma factor [Thauera linaloolentis]
MNAVNPFSDTVTALYKDHHGWLHGWLRSKLGCSQRAADLAHDTFERLWKAGATPALEQPRAYLTVIAKRLAINQFRRQALEQAYLEVLAQQHEQYAPSAEDQVAAIEALAEIWRLLDGMPERRRKVFLMAQFEGLPHAEIARRLGTTLNVVHKEAAAALQHCYLAIYSEAAPETARPPR